MTSTTPYARDARVFIETGGDAPSALGAAIATAGFLAHVERAAAGAGRSREAFAIAIKPTLMTASGGRGALGDRTDPQLVEQLIGVLRAAGFTTVAVVESALTGLPAVSAVAADAGYSGDGYRIVDLAEEPLPFAYGGVLGDDLAGRTWLEADYRISFGKCKTQWQCFYGGCLVNLYGCLPRADKLAHYHGTGHEFYECCVLLADRLPVDFALLDAWVGGDGRRSHAHRRGTQQTRQILASENAFALDWVAGEKMGLDPNLSFVLQEALLRWGRIAITRRGDITSWSPWRNVRPATVVAVHLLEPALRRRFVRTALRLAGARGRRLAAWTVQ